MAYHKMEEMWAKASELRSYWSGYTFSNSKSVDIETTSINSRKPYFEKVCRDLLFKVPNSVF